MPKWLLLAFAAAELQAAVIRGVVVENQTGKPLARAVVVAQPVAGTKGQPLSTRTNPFGAFEFPPVGAGAYLITASKRSFATLHYGQRQSKSAGIPLVLEEGSTPFLSLRLKHFGSIAGTVVDENDVGLPEQEVVAYRNTRPPQIMGRAQTDERGMYRISGLEPGSYVVRTAAKQYDEGGYLPTFPRQTARLDEARAVDVNLDQQSDDVMVQPLPGQLFSVAGQAVIYPQSAVTLTLVSDMGKQASVSDAAGNYRFQPQAPGTYELYAQAAGKDGRTAGYRLVVVDRERTDYRINLGALPGLALVLEDAKGQPVDPRKVEVMIRRKDLAGTAAPELLRQPLKLLPGRFELALTPSPSYYAAGFSGPRADVERGRADGWNEIVLAEARDEMVKFVLSPNPGSVHGTVTNADHDAVPGALVFLEAYDPASRRRLLDLRSARSDINGKYRFDGLAPGSYRVLSSFEFQEPDAAALDAAGALQLTAEEGHDLKVDLELFVIRAGG